MADKQPRMYVVNSIFMSSSVISCKDLIVYIKQRAKLPVACYDLLEFRLRLFLLLTHIHFIYCLLLV